VEKRYEVLDALRGTARPRRLDDPVAGAAGSLRGADPLHAVRL